MSRDPGSVWAPLPEAGAPDGLVKNKFIVHSTGDNKSAADTRAFFAGATPNESTFIIGWGPEDPTLQIMDSTDVADANMAANDEGISVEVVGDGKGGYNAWQRSELIRIGIWARREHPLILPQIIPSPAQSSAGYGWHVMFGAPGPWAGAPKICPGAIRIAELKADIFPAIFTDQEDDMYGPDQRAELVKLGQEILGNTRSTNMQTAADAVKIAAIHAAVKAQPVDVNALADRITANLVPAVVAELGEQAGLTGEDVEAAVRRVLGSLDAA